MRYDAQIMTDTAKTPWIRLRAVRPLLEWFTQAAIRECAVAVYVLPDDVLADREALTVPRIAARQHPGGDAGLARPLAPDSRPGGTA